MQKFIFHAFAGGVVAIGVGAGAVLAGGVVAIGVGAEGVVPGDGKGGVM